MTQYPAYPRYSPEGFPDTWEKKRLRFALTMNPSKSEVKLDGSELVSFVPMDAVGEYGGIRLDEEKELSEIGGGYTYFCEDDVVVAKITPCFENGKAALAQGLTNGIAFGTTELHVLRANHRCLKPQFLFYLTISDQFRKFGESEMYGAGGQKRVPELFFKNFFTAFPSLDEQQTIACFLDFKTAQIDSLIAKQETLLEKLAEKRTALVSHAVTKGLDPKVEMKDSAVEFLGKIPAHWAVLPLRRLIHTVKTGTTPSGVNQYHFDDEGLDWFRPGDFSDQIFLESAGRRLSEEGVAETRVFPAFTVMHVGIGATIGKVGVALQQGSCNQQINAIVCNDKLHCIFAAYFLRAIREYIVKCGKYTTLPIINQDETKALFFAVPPIDEQIKISDCLLHEEVLIKQQQEKIVVVIDRLREYRAALITNAVSGKIDVRDFAIPRLTVESPCDESEAAWH